VGDASSYSLHSVTPGAITLSECENAEVLVHSLETQFQPITVPSVPSDFEMVDVALRS
jgi:hypothetical protein